MASSQRIVPNLWFPGTAEQAVDFYLDIFGQDSRLLAQQYYPDEGLPDFQRDFAGELLVADFTLRGTRFGAINAGPAFTPTPALSFMLNVDPQRYDSTAAARQDLEHLWTRLADGGQVLMPLDEYDFSQRYGWVQDRYGFSWQLILTDPQAEPRPFLVPAFIFGGPQQNRAAEAIDYWTKCFPDAQLGHRVNYLQDTGPATTASVMFSDLRLAGQWFVAMDAGAEQDFTFTEAISLVIACRDQDEIDRYWAALSAVPEAEQCGWCKDRFGVSWQIVPQHMEQLMGRPGAYEAMLSMKKLVIADF